MANAFAFDDDEDEKPKKKSRRPADDDEDDEPPPPPKKKPAPKPRPPVDEDEDDEEEVRPKPKKKVSKPVDDDEEEERPKLSRRELKDAALKKRISLIGRLLSPPPFLFCIILFFLPWTDLSCSSKEMGTQQLLTQSGFQSATGGYSEGSAFTQFKAMGKAGATTGGSGKTDMGPTELVGGSKKEPDKAFLLWVYLLLLVVGLGLPVALGNMRLRGVVICGLAGLAFAVVALQAVIGFPLASAAADAKKQEEKEAQEMKKAGMSMPGSASGMAIKSSFLISFYVTALFLAGTGAFGLLQIIMGGSGKPKSNYKPRKRPKEDDEDED